MGSCLSPCSGCHCTAADWAPVPYWPGRCLGLGVRGQSCGALLLSFAAAVLVLQVGATSHCMQVRCYVGDNEQRWMMWYSGHDRQATPLDSLYPAAGSIGTCSWHACYPTIWRSGSNGPACQGWPPLAMASPGQGAARRLPAQSQMPWGAAWRPMPASGGGWTPSTSQSQTSRSACPSALSPA